MNSSGVPGSERHEWCMAGVFPIWSEDMDVAALVGNTALTVYTVVGTLLE